MRERRLLAGALLVLVGAVGCATPAAPGTKGTLPSPSPVPSPAPDDLRVSFAVRDAPIADVLRALAAQAPRAVFVAPSIAGTATLTLTFDREPWRLALDRVLRASGCAVRPFGEDGLLVEPFVRRRLVDADLRAVLGELASLARLRLALAPDVKGNFSLDLDGETAMVALERVVLACQLSARRGGRTIAVSREPLPWGRADEVFAEAPGRWTSMFLGRHDHLDIEVEDVRLLESGSPKRGINLLVDPDVSGQLTVNARRVLWQDVIAYAAWAFGLDIEARGSVVILVAGFRVAWREAIPAARLFELLWEGPTSVDPEARIELDASELRAASKGEAIELVALSHGLRATTDGERLVVTRGPSLPRPVRGGPAVVPMKIPLPNGRTLEANLDAVVTGRRGRRASINGRAYEAGESLAEGVTLDRIGDRSVELSVGGEAIRLELR